MDTTIRFYSSTDLNTLLTLADQAYTLGYMDRFQSALDLIDRHFYALSIIPTA